MSRLPLLLSVPHAGLRIPDEVEPYNALTPEQIAEDGDEGAREIYALKQEVEAFVTTEIARAFVDLNRAADDRRRDGVVKTHTCWDVVVYDPFPAEEIVEELLATYWRPYHARLTELSSSGVRLGVDCHTMATHGPPVGPDAGRERPAVCLSNADGTCPDEWMGWLVEAFRQAFERPVSVNDPFKGGYITRSHATEMPWVQLELSRAAFLPLAEKRERTPSALSIVAGRIA
jgi:formiminoglutamase